MIDVIKESIDEVESRWEDILESSRHKELEIKKHQTDFLTEADKQIERIVREVIHCEDSNSKVVGEEFGNDTSGDRIYYVDPIDGTFNFANGLPEFCVSIGCEYNDEIISSGVYFPIFDTKIFCSNKKGLDIRGDFFQRRFFSEEFSPSGKDSVEGASLAIDVFSGTMDDLEPFRNRLQDRSVVRQPMCGVYSMIMVCSGSFDSGVYSGLHPWDMCAGYLISQNVGCKITNFKGSSEWVDIRDSGKFILSGNEDIHEELMRMV